MYKIFRSLLVILFVGNVHAQIDQKIELTSPDFNLLEQQTFKAVNDLRSRRKITLLVWDEVLHRAAKDHALYLLGKKVLSHDQETSETATPYKRVKLHGGLVYSRVGENLVSVSLGVDLKSKGKLLNTKSYEGTATTLAALWKGSPLHYKNILERNFNTSALAIAYDAASRQLVAVQVFGEATQFVEPWEQPDHSVELLTTPERKLAFGLRDGDQSEKESKKSVRAFLRLKGVNGNLTGSYKTGKKAFRGRRSGIAVEWIPLTQFDSGALDYNLVRNRRNGLFPLNGNLQRPVYRRELLKYSRRASPRYLFLDLKVLRVYRKHKRFIYPVGVGSGANIFLINKKKLITHTTPMGLPGELLYEPLPSLRFRHNIKTDTREQRFKTETRIDTLTVKVCYESRVIDIDAVTAGKIVRDLERIRGKVVKVEAFAFASIDGEMKENQELAKQRATNFMKLVKPYLDTVAVVPSVVSREQWPLFLKQLEVRHLSHLQKLDKRALRIYVNQNKGDSVISRLLKEQRFALFKMVIRHDSLIPIPVVSAIEKYNKQKKLFETRINNTAAQVTALEDAQLKAYAEMQTETMVDSLSIIASPYYPAFQYHDLMYEYDVAGKMSDVDFYKRLHRFRDAKYFPARQKGQLVYNNLVLIYRNYFGENHLASVLDSSKFYCEKYRRSEFRLRKVKRLKCGKNDTEFTETYFALKEFSHLISLAKAQNISRATIDSMQRFYTTAMIHELYAPILPKEISKHVARVKSLFHPNENLLSLQERARLASFYCAVDKTEIARRLLEPVINDRNLDPEARKLYIALQLEVYNRKEFVNFLIDQYSFFEKEQWCSIWTEGKFLNHVLLEDLKLKKFYNCNCR
jgi:uncharacterized protein YkwD